MTSIHNLFEQLTFALGWTVVHSLWQAVLLAMILGAALLLLKDKSPNLRYAIANGTLALLLFIAIGTFAIHLQLPDSSSAAAQITVFTNEYTLHYISESIGGAGADSLIQWVNSNTSVVVSIWFLGMLFFAIKLIGGWLYLQRLRYTNNIGAPRFWQKRLTSLQQQIGISRSVELLESSMAAIPMAIGWLKPVILLPFGTINTLPPDQVESILAHELAHIKRHDFLLNIFLSIIELLFYYHPAIWWISSQIRKEREHCCDDIALQTCNSPLTYARALTSIQEFQYENTSLAMALGTNRFELLNRVKRILNQNTNQSTIMEKLTAGLLIMVVSIFITFSAYASYHESKEISVSFMDEYKKVNSTPICRTETDKKISDKLVINEPPPPPKPIKTDTLDPGTQRTHSTISINTNNLKLQARNGEITEMEIDGKVIPPEDYHKYEENIHIDVPEPPHYKIYRTKPSSDLSIDKIELEELDELLDNLRESITIHLGESLDEVNIEEIEINEEIGDNIKIEIRKALTELDKHRTSRLDEELSMKDEEIERIYDRAKRKVELSIKTIERELEHEHEMERMEIQIERMERDAERKAERMERDAERMERDAERMERDAERMERDAESMERDAERMERNVEKHHKIHDNFLKQLEKHLLKDKLIKSKKKYKVLLSLQTMQVNGKNVSRSLHKKYLKIYEDIVGKKVDGKMKISINQ